MTLDGPPPGWYPDPSDGTRQRWWNGQKWTAQEKRGRRARAKRLAAWAGGGIAGLFALLVVIGLLAPDPATQPAGTAANTTPTVAPATTAPVVASTMMAPTSPSHASTADQQRKRAAEQEQRAAAARQAAKKKAQQEQRAAQEQQAREKAARRAQQRKKEQQKRQRALSPVLRVVDGDTVHVAYRGTDISVRVIGIDTPETVSPSVPDECGGQAATAMAHRLLDGRQVQLVHDASQGRYDKYGRTLAYLDIPGVGDYGKIMITKGLAAEYTYDSAYHRQAAYQSAQATARAANRGTWAHCGSFDKQLHGQRKATKPAPFVPAAPPAPAPHSNCAPGYSPCIPPYPPDLDCADVNGPITVTGNDPHGLDRDGDGIACESG